MKHLISKRSFSSRIDRYNQVQRMNMPVVNYMDFSVPDKLVEGVSITTYEYTTKTNPRAVMYFIPEYGDYCYKYGNFFKIFASHGVRVFSQDFKVFGMSQGKRGQLGEWFYNNQLDFIDQIGFLKGFHLNIPKFIFGNGFGGLVALRLLQQRPDIFQGAVLLNPLMKFKNPPSQFQIMKYQAQKLVNPTAPVELNIDHDAKEFQKQLKKIDDLYQFQWQVGNLMQVINDQWESQQKLKDVQTPLLMLLSHKDTIGDYKEGKKTFDEIGSKDKKLIEYPGGDNFMMMLQNDVQALEKDIFAWVSQRVK